MIQLTARGYMLKSCIEFIDGLEPELRERAHARLPAGVPREATALKPVGWYPHHDLAAYLTSIASLYGDDEQKVHDALVATGRCVARNAAGTFMAFEGRIVRLKDRLGIRYLDTLLANPVREIHVMELVGSASPDGDTGAVLDQKAKQDYRRRLEQLHDDLAEAMSFSDRGRVARAREEIDAINGQLAQAVGLGGRDRRSGSPSERARVNVQRRLRDALDRIEKYDASLGDYLRRTIRTGTYCAFAPLER
jgi:hypothetical protein